MSVEGNATLELDSPQHHQTLHWESYIERAGWLAMAAALLASLAGYLGPGSLSHRTAGTPDGRLRITYDAIVHSQAPCELKVVVNQPLSPEETVSVAISDSWTSATKIERIAPEPISEEVTDQGILYTYRTADAEPSKTIVYRYEHTTFGRLHYTVALADHDPVKITQVVLP